MNGWATALCVVPFLCLLTLTYIGIDFGVHWDEPSYKITAVAQSVQNGMVFLPNGYIYPSLNYWLVTAALTPELLRTAKTAGLNAAGYRTLLPFIGSKEFGLRVRYIYGFIASLSAAWVYLTLLIWRRSWADALFGSLVLALSWEVVYHSRWIAPDSLVMQFGSLTALLTTLAWKYSSKPALYAAAAAAGLACGAKYPGALLMIMPLTVIGLHHSDAGPVKTIRQAVAAMGLFVCTYLVTTPGTIIQPIKFLSDIAQARTIYATGWYGHTVHSVGEHALKMAVYFSVSAFSAIRVVAVLLILFCIIGLWAVSRQGWRSALVLFGFPAAYVAFFAVQKVMIVRNYLVLLPFLALLAGFGFGWLRGIVSPRWKAALMALAALLIGINGVQQLQAARSVRNRQDTEAFLSQFVQYAANHPNERFVVMPRLMQTLLMHQEWASNMRPADERHTIGPGEVFAGYYKEIVPQDREWPHNWPGVFVRTFGPQEINFDYYIVWWGDDRIVVLGSDKAREVGFAPH